MQKNIKNKNEYIRHRRDGRVVAFQALFAYDFNQSRVEELLKFDWLEKEISAEAIEYSSFLIKGTIDSLDFIDNVIKSKLRNWDFKRISCVDKAVLRFSIFSMFFEKELPEKIIINEAVEIAKNFGAEDSYKFINGILDAIKRSKDSSK